MIRRWLIGIVSEAFLSKPVVHVESNYGPTDRDIMQTGSIWTIRGSGKRFEAKLSVEWIEVEK